MLCEKCKKRTATVFYNENINGKTRSYSLCAECAALDAYARQRSDRCPFMETKTFCSNCRVHCYQPQMRERIRAVMRFSGPRMLTVHPVLAMRHVIESRREKRRMNGKG